jgi:hypothetical protein
MGIVIPFPLHKCRVATRHFDEPAVVIVLPLLRIPRLTYVPTGSPIIDRIGEAIVAREEQCKS